MNKKIKRTLLIISSILVVIFCYIFVFAALDAKRYTIYNNSTRDYNYEHYCDSVYITNPNYYFDVIVESDEFQQYIDNHGEWWAN